mgnify:CR=1 FL=1
MAARPEKPGGVGAMPVGRRPELRKGEEVGVRRSDGEAGGPHSRSGTGACGPVAAEWIDLTTAAALRQAATPSVAGACYRQHLPESMVRHRQRRRSRSLRHIRRHPPGPAALAALGSEVGSGASPLSERDSRLEAHLSGNERAEEQQGPAAR